MIDGGIAMNDILKSAVETIISDLNVDRRSLIVLKGVPPLDEFRPDLMKLADEPFEYFSNAIIRAKRRSISYEEFLMLESFILTQYDRIIVLNNNACGDKYPLERFFTPEVERGLLNHFTESEDEDDDTPLGSIDNLIKIYSGIELRDDQLFGTYCEIGTDDPKIQTRNIFPDLPQKIDQSPFTSEPSSKTFRSRAEYAQFLKRYWHHESFLDFTVYDIASLAEGRKSTYKISQERIIAELVEQVEACAEFESSPRDLFVTAPTGAGKSAIFQIAAMYLAEHHGLFTIVISPLVALMNDMVGSLKLKKYPAAETMTSETSQVEREKIMNDIAEGKCHMLFIAPEMLLARSSVEQLIGDRTIGMIVIDEAHIVTTWGKQFRPDYWFLGAHIAKLRKRQLQNKGRSFIIAAFTATAIYRGVEDMYAETRDSLQMIDPITYFGYVRRNDITIAIDRTDMNTGDELLSKKFRQLEGVIGQARIFDEKTLIYFPTVTLIDQFYEYLHSHQNAACAVRYYGPLDKDLKREAYENFKASPVPLARPIMLATKAFGMGIDIGDIKNIVHFAPTGGVCDYVQEIGRAARRPDITGEAIYFYDRRDFKFINRLHGLSGIKKYQIVEIVKKIYALHCRAIQSNGNSFVTKKRNAMLIDAENFSYLFNDPRGFDVDNAVSKVKTALLLLQKDFEAKVSFPPLVVRPVPLFSSGFFKISPLIQRRLLSDFPNCLTEINSSKKICRVKLGDIWNRNYRNVSFPQFKYLLYSRSKDFEFNQRYSMTPALRIDIKLASDFLNKFRTAWSVVKKIIFDSIRRSAQLSFGDIAERLEARLTIKKYKAQSNSEVLLASIAVYENLYRTGIAEPRPGAADGLKYQFKAGIKKYFDWIERLFNRIVNELESEQLFVVNTSGNDIKEYGTVLGVLESFDVLTFKMLGGAGSQLYIYINQYRYLKSIVDDPTSYKNRLLEAISYRHRLNVEMLTYIYENDFDSDRVWDVLEDYFLGIIPPEVKAHLVKNSCTQ